MELEQTGKVYFLGIGGIGMSALARYFMTMGKRIAGYDRTETNLSRTLEAEGAAVHYTDDVNLIPEDFRIPSAIGDALIVFTPAIPRSSTELTYFINNGYTVLKRAAVLGAIADRNGCIGIAGTHGKTTVTSIIAHIMKSAGVSSNTFLGGISVNYGTNYIREGDGRLVIAEADEYDRSFLCLHPDTAVITSLDPDHLDVYGDLASMTGTYLDFTGNVKAGGTLLLSDRVSRALRKSIRPAINCLSYSLEGDTEYSAQNIDISDGRYRFDLQTPGGHISGFELAMGGRHNVENAVAAIAVAGINAVSFDDIRKALCTYRGVRRRFEVVFQSAALTYIDDYAHHPGEITCALNAVRELYPGKKLTVIFQPHLYSRTRDFSREFAQSLSLADKLILLDIYPAREEPIEGITSKIIYDQVELHDKIMCTKEDVIDLLDLNAAGVLITLGAGDIDRLVEPISTLLNAS